MTDELRDDIQAVLEKHAPGMLTCWVVAFEAQEIDGDVRTYGSLMTARGLTAHLDDYITRVIASDTEE